MAKFTVVEPLRHAGQDYQPGEVVEMAQRDAEQLVAADVLRPMPSRPPGLPKSAPGDGK